MYSIRIFRFSHDSLLCTEWPTGIEGRVLPLWSITALRLNWDASKKSHESRGLWLILSVCFRPWVSMQATRLLFILEIWTRSLCLFWYTEFLTFSFITHRHYSRADTCIPSQVFYALGHASCIMTTRGKNWILKSYLVSAHWIEEESAILVTDYILYVEQCNSVSCNDSNLWYIPL